MLAVQSFTSPPRLTDLDHVNNVEKAAVTVDASTSEVTVVVSASAMKSAQTYSLVCTGLFENGQQIVAGKGDALMGGDAVLWVAMVTVLTILLVAGCVAVWRSRQGLPKERIVPKAAAVKEVQPPK